MTSTRRILAAVALATGASAFAAPAATAAGTSQQVMEVPSVISRLDSLSASSVTPEHRAEMPTVTGQLGGLNQGVSRLNELHQLTDLVAPVTGLLPAVES
ncbi:hypothetical protein ACFVT5_16880 [Streptomyces sp. NPDC058001]|uniref:hypothetical protein n=1 Tax=Streptomyces sp. NPDC058001 TaxID=3346300 RepID=UPI0036EF9017